MWGWAKKLLSGKATDQKRKINDYFYLDAAVDPLELHAGQWIKHSASVYTWTSPDVDAPFADFEVDWENPDVSCNGGQCLDQALGRWLVRHSADRNTWLYGDWGRASEGWRTEALTYLQRTPTSPSGPPLTIRATARVGVSEATYSVDVPFP